MGTHSREGDTEVEALAQAAEGDKGLGREAARGHLAVGPLEVAGGAHAVEAPDEQVHAGAPVLAHAIGAAARANVHLAVVSCRVEQDRRSHSCPRKERPPQGPREHGYKTFC